MIKGIIKTAIFASFVLAALFGASNFVFAQADQKEIIFFYSPTCSHCAAEKQFLDGLEKKYPEIQIKRYEFSQNIGLIKEFYKKYNVPASEQGFVPATFTRDKYFIGFNDQTGKEIEGCIQHCLENKDPSEPSQQIKIPILSQIDIKKMSLPLLSVVLGFLDGFNVCSLGSLVLILGIAITLRSKKHILILGGGYILVTITIYWILIFLWHRVFTMLSPYIKSMEILMGILSFAGAWYLFREFLKSRKKGAVCKLGGISEKMSKRINDAFEKNTGILAIISAVLIFAAAITIIEFPCSAIFPVLFTNILAQSNVPFAASLLYMTIYTLFYMLDEIIVLLIAVFTMKIWVASPKIAVWANLLASAILLIFGLYYFFGFL